MNGCPQPLATSLAVIDTCAVVILAVLALALVLALAVLTALGAHRRGSGALPSVVAGLFFPITWTIWYVRDEHPYRRSIAS